MPFQASPLSRAQCTDSTISATLTFFMFWRFRWYEYDLFHRIFLRNLCKMGKPIYILSKRKDVKAFSHVKTYPYPQSCKVFKSQCFSFCIRTILSTCLEWVKMMSLGAGRALAACLIILSAEVGINLNLHINQCLEKFCA